MTDRLRKLTYVSPDEIKSNPNNPRKHPRSQIRALAKSIAAFGFNAPILVDCHMQVLAGHGRLEAGRVLKLKLIPVIRLDDLSELEASRDGALLYCCMDWRHLQEMQTAGAECALELVNLCVWVKSNGGMGTFYRSRHEMVFVFKKGAGPHCNNVQLGRFGRNRTNVWHYPGANVPSAGNALQYHPTPKPIALVADALLDCTLKGDYVLDPFLGSGTTLLAAERTGRRALGIELDPLYVDTAIIRWQKMTRAKALLNGQAFADVRVERVAS